MKKCNKCNVLVNMNRKTCPLCEEILVDDGKEMNVVLYPSYDHKKTNKSLIKRTFSFLFIVALISTVVVNYYTFSKNPKPWSGYVIAGVIYAWILISHDILSNRLIGEKVVSQTVTLSGLAIAVDLLINFPNWILTWSIEFIVPFITIASTISILILITIKKTKYRDNIFYLMISILFGFVPLLLLFLKVISEENSWPSVAAGGLSLITILGIIFFADKQTKIEIKKRFHI